jgi:hypothetical protein
MKKEIKFNNGFLNELRRKAKPLSQEVLDYIEEESKKPFIPLKPDLWGPLTEAELKRYNSWGDSIKEALLELEKEDDGLKL